MSIRCTKRKVGEKVILDGVTVGVCQAQIGVVGPNGMKSTLLKVIAGMEGRLNGEAKQLRLRRWPAQQEPR